MGDGRVFHFMKTMQRSHTHQTDQVLMGTQATGCGWQMGCDSVGPFWESYLTISCQVEEALLPSLCRTCLLHVRKNVRGSAAFNCKRLQVTCAPLHKDTGQSHSGLRAAHHLPQLHSSTWGSQTRRRSKRKLQVDVYSMLPLTWSLNKCKIMLHIVNPAY